MNAFQCTFDRAKLGFKHIAFEDNCYPSDVGDVYIVKLALSGLGYSPTGNLRYWIDRFRGIRREVEVKPNRNVAAKLEQVIDVYREMQLIFLPGVSRWGYSYSSNPTEKPLLVEVEEDWHQIFYDEAKWYTWLAYLKLK